MNQGAREAYEEMRHQQVIDRLDRILAVLEAPKPTDWSKHVGPHDHATEEEMNGFGSGVCVMCGARPGGAVE